MALQSLDIRRISATTVPAPQVREPVTGTVAKLIDVSKCIGCKACQTACMEWNDLRDEVGKNVGVYDNPRRSDRAFVDRHALLRVRERRGRSRVADPQGRLHALRGPGLSEGLSVAGRDRAVHERHRRFPRGKLHRLRLLHHRLPVQRAAHFEEGPPRVQVHAVFGSRGGRVRNRPA